MVRDDVNAYASQLPAYFRVDLRLAIRLNKLKRASVLGIDIQNATNQKNVFNENFDVVKREVVYFYQSGLIPVISWRMDF
jgi:outer membrane receptor protein involved in Fe transport